MPVPPNAAWRDMRSSDRSRKDGEAHRPLRRVLNIQNVEIVQLAALLHSCRRRSSEKALLSHAMKKYPETKGGQRDGRGLRRRIRCERQQLGPSFRRSGCRIGLHGGRFSRRPSFEPFLAGTIVAGSCVGLGRTSLGLTSTPFDLVIVDEAARANCSCGCKLLDGAVLAGDHAQLDRITKLKSSSAWQVYGRHAAFSLKPQYRMLPPIGRLVSEVFYPDLKLEPGRLDPEVDRSCLPSEFDRPLLWIDTDRLGERGYERVPSNGSSRINQAEAHAIVALLEKWLAQSKFMDWLTSQTKHDAGIGVIRMYAAQRDLVRRASAATVSNTRMK